MKKISAAIVIAFVLLLSNSATTFGWTVVNSKEGKFKIQFPSKPKESAKLVKSPTGDVTMNVFMLDAGAGSDKENKLYMTIYSDYPNQVINSGMRKGKVDTFLTNAILGSIENMKGKIISQDAITYKKYPGKHTVISFSGGRGIMDMKMFLIKNRIYVLEVGYENGFRNVPSMSKFFSSFEILP